MKRIFLTETVEVECVSAHGDTSEIRSAIWMICDIYTSRPAIVYLVTAIFKDFSGATRIKGIELSEVHAHMKGGKSMYITNYKNWQNWGTLIGPDVDWVDSLHQIISRWSLPHMDDLVIYH